jgi:hypothetical protein
MVALARGGSGQGIMLMLSLLLSLGEVGEVVSLPLSSVGEEETETATILGAAEVEVEVSLQFSLLREVEVELETESEVTARFSCVDVDVDVDVSAVDDTAVTNAAPIAPVGRADKRTLDCCCRIEVKGKLMGTREGSIRLLLVCLS